MFTLRDQCGARHREGVRAGHFINPAKAAGIADEVGSIAVGKRADVLLVRGSPAAKARSSGEHPGARPDGPVAHDARGRARRRGRPLGVPLALSRPAALGYGRDTEQPRLARPADPPSGQGGVAWRSSESTACPKPSCSIA